MDKIYFETLDDFYHKEEIINSPLYYHTNDLFHRTKGLFNKDVYDTLTKITEIENFDNYFKNCYGISLEKDGNPVLLGRNAKIISNKVTSCEHICLKVSTINFGDSRSNFKIIIRNNT